MSNEELLARIEVLETKLKLLEADSTIPHDVEQAFTERLRIRSFTPQSISSKGATSENQSVNESGSNTYSVLKPPDLFLQVTVAGGVYYIPVFT